jgi:hypothetical protein
MIATMNGKQKSIQSFSYAELLEFQKEAEEAKKIVCDRCLERIRQKNKKVGSIEVNFETGSPFIWYILLEVKIRKYVNISINIYINIFLSKFLTISLYQ